MEPTARSENEDTELTEAELGIWLGHQRLGGGSLYNAAECQVLHGPLDTRVFAAALDGALREATSLHVAFRERAGVPFRRALPYSSRRVEVVDLSTAPDPDAALERVVEQALSRAFLIEEGELFSHSLLRLGPERHAWLHVAHHVALDGYGFNLIARRVAQHYEHLLAGERSEENIALLGGDFAPFAPVAARDRAYQSSAERERDRAFWRSELGICSGVAWGASRSLSPAAARRLRSSLSPERAARLRRLAGRPARDWTEVFLAAVAAFVHERTGSVELCLGLPVMLRLGTPALNVPCMAMNIAPVPLRFGRESTLFDLAAEVRAALARQRRHHRYRYEHLRAERGRGARLFGPVVNLMPFDFPLRFGPCESEARSFSAGPVEDLSLAIVPRGGDFELHIDGHPELFTLEDLRETRAGLLGVLDAWLDEPSRPVGDFRRGRASHRSSAPAPSVKVEQVQPIDVVAAVVARAKSAPDAPALVSSERTWSYRELELAVRALSRLLRDTGAAQGELLALELPRSPVAIALLVAARALGLGYVALDPAHPSARRRAVLEQVKPRVLVQAQGAVDPVPPSENEDGTVRITLSANALDPWVRRGARLPDIELRDWHDAPAYVVFTSGSTGTPKGVVISGSALAHFLGAARAVYGITEQDRVLQFASLTFDASVEEVFGTLVCGATLVLRDDALLDSMSAFVGACERWRLTVLDLPTAFWHELVLALERGLRLPACVRLVIIGGEAALPARVAAWQRVAPTVRLLNTYGPSEATVVATVADLGSWHAGEEGVPIGRPLPGVSALLVDEGRVLEGEASGELYLVGPTLADGYWADATRERFVELSGYGRAYRTGDRARRNRAGELVFEGRADDEVKLSGYRIAPAEVEAALVRHPEVGAAVVRGETDAHGNKHLVAYVEAPQSLDGKALRAFLAQLLPEPMVPTVYWVTSRLPRSSHGKLDRARLSEVVAASSRENKQPSATLPPEVRLVAGIWRELLGVTATSADDDFFALGGDSLKLIQLVNRLSQAGADVTVAAVFQNPTLRAQARLCAGAGVGLGSAGSSTSAPQNSDEKPFVASEVELPRAWFDRARTTNDAPRKSELGRVLLTGATGFVGIHVLGALLERTPARVVCLTRARSEAEARERLLGAALAHGVSLTDALERIEVVRAFEGASRRDELLARLESPDALIHAAAQVSLTRSYESLRDANVLLTRELLGVAAHFGCAFHHVSTVATAPHSPGQIAVEEFFSAHAGLRDGYQRSKWHAEELCRLAGERGLSVAVHRLGRVTGARSAPRVNPADLVWRIAQVSTRLGAWPDLSVSEPWTPADTVATTLVDLVATGCASSPASVYHLVQTGSVGLERVHGALRRQGYALSVLPLGAWLERLHRLTDDDARATAALFEHTSQSELPPRGVNVELSSRRVQERLPNADQRPVDDALLDAYCASARAQGLLAPL